MNPSSHYKHQLKNVILECVNETGMDFVSYLTYLRMQAKERGDYHIAKVLDLI
jgi:hypothetical protein